MKCFDSHLYMGRHLSADPLFEQLGADELPGYLKREGVGAAFVMPYSSAPGLDGFDQLRHAHRRTPGRVFPVARLPASEGLSSGARTRLLQQLGSYYASGSLYGLKIHLGFERPHGDILAWCEHRQMPTIWHLPNRESFGWFEQEVLPRYAFPMILAHFGGYPADRTRYGRAIALLDRYPYVYLDTSCVVFHHYLATAIARAPDRVLFASDGPAVSPRAARALIEALRCSGKMKRQVLATNALRLVAAVRAERDRAVRAGELGKCPLPLTPQELHDLGFVIVPPSQFAPDEARQAGLFSSGCATHGERREDQASGSILREYVAALKPETVIEFGCNVARNLHSLREAFPNIHFSGVDINPAAVEKGRSELGLDLQVADEEIFYRLERDSFDLIYTVSVLQHMPAVQRACRGMLRCSRAHVLCVEVSLPVEGRVLKHFDHEKQEAQDSAPHSYSWDYDRIFRAAGAVWVDARSAYRDPAGLGPYYKSFLAYKS
jgi:hypothetical protein